MKPSRKVLRTITKAWREIQGPRASREIASKMAVSVALHEAGHFAAGVFFWDVPLSASIIPTAVRAGYVGVHHDRAASLIEHNPELKLHGRGYSAIMKLLAGLCAEQETIDLDEDNPDEQQVHGEGSDLFRAARIADVMARRGYPARRVLNRAEKLTRDMLAIPDVWACVERVARLLLEHGTIEDAATLVDSEFASVLGMGMKLTKWRRLLLT